MQCSFTNSESAEAARLSSLTVTDCVLSPEFSPTTYVYEAICEMLPRSVTVTPVTDNPDSEITVYLTSDDSTIQSGEELLVQSYDYDDDNENIIIKVTSPDGEYSYSYSLTVKEEG
jgi:hypothetical protein